MPVHSEALPGSDTVFVDDSQRLEVVMLGIEVIAKRKRVERVEPSVIEMASVDRALWSNSFHVRRESDARSRRMLFKKEISSC